MPEHDLTPLTARVAYDAADVDALVLHLRTELETTRSELRDALARAEAAEARVDGGGDATVLGRAMLLVQRAADEILEEARQEAERIRAAAGEAVDAAFDLQAEPAPAPVLVPEHQTAPEAEEPDADVEPHPSIRPRSAGVMRDRLRAAIDAQLSAPSTDRPAWLRDPADVAADDDGGEYFQALREALDDDEPLGPRDEDETDGDVPQTRREGLRVMPFVRAIVPLLFIASVAGIAGPALHLV